MKHPSRNINAHEQQSDTRWLARTSQASHGRRLMTHESHDELCGAQPGQPLTANIDHSDFEQADVGNCWLMAAISAVAEHAPEKGDHNTDIDRLFLTKHYYPGQPVQIQLYHVDKHLEGRSTLEPVVYNVQDCFLQKKDGSGGFTVNPREPEDAWVLFLEAAFAMMMGKKNEIDIQCYQELDKGGFSHWALMAMTGTNCVDVIKYHRETGTGRVHNLGTGQTGEVSREEVWQMLLAAEEAAELLCCGVGDINRDGQAQSAVNGVQEGHAYSIKEVFVNEEGMPVVRVRNPWGSHNGLEDQLEQLSLGKTYVDGMVDLDLDTFLGHYDQIFLVNRTRGGSYLDLVGDQQQQQPYLKGGTDAYADNNDVDQQADQNQYQEQYQDQDPDEEQYQEQEGQYGGSEEEYGEGEA